ncbi:hypothetical protein Terro_4351 [Terriglobus roseus DSM 18391]|uniref:Uncharacterized protein n=1 Tax=Terriglobus roseus (strain DSM 18391 / NRRL B-41598 / KBS 63) TaxID=926566 RepID=I3ZMT0_TERRK|nr:hypothetical protein [Terriglobus roseus]AFL90548.1 hypothetical protein Terro_4351 [Terriglobus roseus DSM 18391]
MNIPCLPTETSFDVQCPVCGCGFLLLTEPTLLMLRGTLRRMARQSLAAQHEGPSQAGGHVHPQEVFDLQGWDGEPGQGAGSWDGEPNLRFRFEC